MALEEEGFKIINNITWQKTNPPPNLACKTFTHSTETILWARKDLPKVKYKFNYNLMKEINDNKMEITSAEFVISNTDVKKCPAGHLPEYAFIGRSNVGKSSLINMLTLSLIHI